MDDYISKPLSQAELNRVLTEYLQGPPPKKKEPLPPGKTEPTSREAAREIPVIGESFSLMDELGDADLVKEIVAEVIDSTREELPGLADLVNEGALTKAPAEAHRIRGALLNLAADRLCARLLELEHACKREDEAGARALLAQAMQDFPDLCRELEERDLLVGTDSPSPPPPQS